MSSIKASAGIMPLVDRSIAQEAHKLGQGNGLTDQQREAKAKLREVAQMYEEQFLREMVKAMRGTVPEGGFIQQDFAQQIYQEQLDHEHIGAWTQQGGAGLADLIFQQLMDRHGVQMGLRPPEQAPRGPIDLKDPGVWEGKLRSEGAGGVQWEIMRGGEDSKNAVDLHTPWESRLIDHRELGNGLTQLSLEHPGNWRSDFLLTGHSLLLDPTKELAPGSPFARLSVDSDRFLWKLGGRPDLPSSGSSQME